MGDQEEARSVIRSQKGGWRFMSWRTLIQPFSQNNYGPQSTVQHLLGYFANRAILEAELGPTPRYVWKSLFGGVIGKGARWFVVTSFC